MGIGGRKGTFDKFDAVTEVRVRFAEIFDEKAEKAVAQEVQPDEEALEGFAVTQEPDNGPQNDAFKKHFVQLGRVARQVYKRPGYGDAGFFRDFPHPRLTGRKRSRVRKDHPQRAGCHPAVKFRVDEIAQPPESIAKRDAGGEHIADFTETDAFDPCVNDNAENGGNSAAVITHSLKAGKLSVAERPEDQPGLVFVNIACFVNKSGKEPCADYQRQYTPAKHT